MNSTRVQRIARELQRLNECPPWGISCIELNAGSIDNLEATIMGPKDTPYECGVFKISICIPDKYPFEPPQLKFLTPIYHPNIDKGGRICMDMLKMPPSGTWLPTITLETLLVSLQTLLSCPNPDDPLMLDIANQFRHSKEEFIRDARAYTQQYALN